MEAAPHPDNLSLRAGVLRFDRFIDGVPQGYTHLGNCQSAELSHEITELEKANDMDGTRGTYKKVITKVSATLAITFNEQTDFNMALMTLGLSELLTQAGEAILNEEINEGEDLQLGKWYRLTQLVDEEYVPVFYPTVTGVKQVGDLEEGVDYEVDRHAGMVRLLEGSSAVEGPADWSGSIPAITDAKRIHGLSTPRIEGRIHYRTASNLVTGPQEDVTFWKVSIRPEGALQLISEEFAVPVLHATVEADLSKPAGEQYYSYVQLPAAPAEGGS